MFKPGVDEPKCLWVRRDLLLGQVCAISETEQSTHEFRRERKSGGEDILWVPGIADLVERVNQGILRVCLERNVEAGWRESKALPVGRDGTPRVLQPYIIPK